MFERQGSYKGVGFIHGKSKSKMVKVIHKKWIFLSKRSKKNYFGVACFSVRDEGFSPNEYLSSRMGLSLLCTEKVIELSHTYSP